MTGQSVAIPDDFAELLGVICAAKNRTLTGELAAAWYEALHDVPVPELRRAFAKYQRDTSPDPRDGRPVGRWMPEPADLLAIIKRDSRSATGRRFEFCGKLGCRDGWRETKDAEGRHAVVRCPDCVTKWREQKSGSGERVEGGTKANPRRAARQLEDWKARGSG